MPPIVLDIETQNTFADVENDFKKLRVSAFSIFRYDCDQYLSFVESELNKLWPFLEKADFIIGYNSEHFDMRVLNNYYVGDLLTFSHLDLMKRIKASIGISLRLNDVAAATLDMEKSADGFKAIQWWKEGKIDEIKKYCEQDVLITKELYEFGKNNRQLFHKSLTGEIIPFAVDFTMTQTGESPSAQLAKGKINMTLPL